MKYVLILLFSLKFSNSIAIESDTLIRNFKVVKIKQSTISKNKTNAFYIIRLKDIENKYQYIILSKITNTSTSYKLKKNKIYTLKIILYYEFYWVGHYGIKIMDLIIDGINIQIPLEKNYNSGVIYTTPNLNGLYLIEDPN